MSQIFLLRYWITHCNFTGVCILCFSIYQEQKRPIICRIVIFQKQTRTCLYINICCNIDGEYFISFGVSECLPCLNCYKPTFDCLVYPDPHVRVDLLFLCAKWYWPKSDGNRASRKQYRLVDPDSIQGSRRPVVNRGGNNGKRASGSCISQKLSIPSRG